MIRPPRRPVPHRWEAWWREPVDVAGAMRLAVVRISARSPEVLRMEVASRCGDALAGEVRLTTPLGRVVWTTIAAIARWRSGDAPDARDDTLWEREVRLAASSSVLLGDLDRLLRGGVRDGVLARGDVSAVVEFAGDRIRRACDFRRP